MTKVSSKHLKEAVRVLGSYAHEYKKPLVWLSVLSIVSALGNAVVPFIAGKLFDSILSPTTVFAGTGIAVSLPWLLLGIWAIIQLVTYTIDWRIDVSSLRLGALVYFNYFSQGFGHLLELPLSFHKRNKVGEIGNKINTAANNLEALFGNVLISLTPQFLSIIGAIGIAFWIEPIVALVLIAGVLLYILAITRLMKPLTGMQRKMFDVLSGSFGDAYDAIFNAQPIKQATAEATEKRKMEQRFSVRGWSIWTKLHSAWIHLTFLQRAIILCTQVAVFSISIVLITNDQMTIGELFALNSYAALIFAPFLQLGRQWEQIMSGLINVYEAEKVLKQTPEPYTPKNDKTPSTITGKVEFDNVSFHYQKDKPILKDISFTAEPGQTIALVGESGVGKSTLVDMISGFHFPKRGVVRIDDVNLRNINLTTLRKHISVVAQEVVLFNDTIQHNIKYGSPKATDAQIRKAAEQANILKDIEKLPKKWKQVVGERGVKLSVGQKQRVAIARAILRDPTILILDEPTSALDASSEHHIQQALNVLMEGRTTFIIAHRLSTVRHADTILVLKEGQIIEFGTHDELLTKEGGEYRRLYDLQIGLHE